MEAGGNRRDVLVRGWSVVVVGSRCSGRFCSVVSAETVWVRGRDGTTKEQRGLESRQRRVGGSSPSRPVTLSAVSQSVVPVIRTR